MLKTLCKLLVLTLLMGSASAHAGKIIKWVDKHGVTHYGDKPPMPTKAKKSTVLNNQGVKVKEIDTRPINTKVEEKQQAQSRHDKALLATYNSVDEIDLAKERNTRIDKLALQGLEKKHQTLTKRLAENNKILLDHAKDNKKAPADTITQVERDTDDLAKLENKISIRKDTLAEINQRYEQDKLRYTELQERKSQLYNIKYTKKNLSDLENWRIDVQQRLDSLHAKSKTYKRRGQPLPASLTNNLLTTTNELERVNQEIAEKQLSIKESKNKFSEQ